MGGHPLPPPQCPRTVATRAPRPSPSQVLGRPSTSSAPSPRLRPRPAGAPLFAAAALSPPSPSSPPRLGAARCSAARLTPLGRVRQPNLPIQHACLSRATALAPPSAFRKRFTWFRWRVSKELLRATVLRTQLKLHTRFGLIGIQETI